MPHYYPICLDLEQLPCLVVGGGKVGLRKVRTLLDHGAKVVVVGPNAQPELVQLAGDNRIDLHDRNYQTSDLDGIRLVFVATDDEPFNQRVAAEAREHGILTNVVDRPALCDFIVPSIVRRGRLMLAISTEGACPAYAKHLRQELENQFDEPYGEYVELLGELRQHVISRAADPDVSGPLIRRLVEENLFTVLREQGVATAKSRALSLLNAWLADSD